MTESPLIEVREPGRPVRRVAVDRALEVGRECDGELLSDEGVSRRHLKLVPSPLGLSVVDLGSRNGTLVNGEPLVGRASLEPGDVIRLGRTELVVVRPLAVRAALPVIPRQTMRAGTAVLDVPPPPPPPPPSTVPPSRLSAAVRRLLVGADPIGDSPVFRSYLELPTRVPRPVWHAVRVVSVLGYLTLCVAMFVRPAGALFAFFKVIVPVLPLLFFVAPGLWRNICPLAAANQTPRLFGFTRGLSTPGWIQRRGYLVAMALFFGIASARLALFNTNAGATGVLLSLTVLTAFTAGATFKGKSGWCSSICPLLPLQRLYGQTPLAVVPNSHCTPCVACTKNCYDFKPQVAYQADVHDPDAQWSAPRRLFAGALPGFVLGFFTLLGHPEMTRPHVYGQLAVYLLVSVGSFFAVEALLPVTVGMVTALYASAAINLFYWYGGVVAADSLRTITGVDAPWVRWPVRVAVAALTVVWLSRTYWVERRFLEETGAASADLIQITPKAAKALQQQAAPDGVEVRILPEGKAVPAEVGMSLLEVAEKDGQQIEAGCRMGVCGADPVAVLEGMDCLSGPEEEELTTLRRLGLASNTRMACCARLQSGSVAMSLTPEAGQGPDAGARPAHFDRSITSVVVLGNGIAGVTAADFIRRGHPDCEVHLVGQESHQLYNRMGISRLVYGRSAMTGLYLLGEQWYAEHGVTAWLNTIATRIDLEGSRVVLGTGDVLVFDRLILATGSSSVVPPVEGFGAPGSFVLRSAEDAMLIRSYAQQHGSREAVVAGGGLLGLEAAYALHELGLQVTVLERGKRLLSRQIDARCSELVQAHFDRLGIRVLYGAEAQSLTGTDRLEILALKDGRSLPCEVFLACVGIRANAALAEQAGIVVNRGVVVDDRMQTSAARVFAAGDVAEHDGLVLGLWPIAAKQGEVAAVNALGGDTRLTAEIPATILKGVGLELSSIGRVEPEPGDEVIVLEDATAPSYRRLVVSRGVLVGALVLGHHPEDLAAATTAVKKRLLLEPSLLPELRAGNWQVLKQAGRQAATAAP
ncbi:MAG: FAD-dependent oxidoreductase [Mycobacteriales bacterium]